MKLLQRVRPCVRSAFDYEGKFVKPGVLLDESELWPSPQWPAVPVALECAGAGQRGMSGVRGHPAVRAEYLYILWQYDRERREWRELGRAQAAAWDWSLELAPIARRALDDGHRPDLAAIALRIRSYFTAELAAVPKQARAAVASVIHDALAAEMTGLSSELPAAAIALADRGEGLHGPS